MTTSLSAFLSYVFVTTFTPGPNNVSSASMGITYGYRGALPYILGITTGFTVIMFLCGLLTEALIDFLPGLEPILKIVGALYMLYLAFMILKVSTRKPDDGGKSIATFSRGLLLQVVNVKVIIFGITVFSGFLIHRIGGVFDIFLASLFLAAFAFASTSTWALFGTGLKRFFTNRTFTLVFNGLMALLLVYSATVIAGIL